MNILYGKATFGEELKYESFFFFYCKKRGLNTN